MKVFLLSSAFILLSFFTKAQNLQNLPAGKYETVIKKDQSKWERGDIILLDDNKYKISSSNEIGDYKFSSAAQRIFFTTGPLKHFYAKTSTNNNTPVIVLPVTENEQAGQKLPAEVWCYYRQ